jgi:hypothetical protein
MRVKGSTHTAPVLTSFLLKSPARHECGVIELEFRANELGSTMLRAKVRIVARIGIAEDIVFGMA